MKFEFMELYRCISQEECKGITLEACDYPLPSMSFRTMSAFDCEKDCKAHENCSFFKFSEINDVCEFFESEFRSGCSDVSATMVGYLHTYMYISRKLKKAVQFSYLNSLIFEL